jgi:glyoxylase-like metal-dependent hydrolase (beta-lactamase superfamily II)
MLGAAAALAAPVVLRATPAGAQAPAPARFAQPPGFFRSGLGGFTVTTLHDGSRTVPLQGFVRNAPLEEVRKVLADAFLPTDSLRIVFTATCVETPRGIVLFDTGNGPQAAGSPVGRLLANMQAAGLDPARVTTVVISHFHGDHINGLLDAQGGKVFQNAEIVVPAAEWAWWTDAGNEARSPEGQRANFANTTRRFAPYQGRIRQVQDGQEAAPGIRCMAAPGHTPGHTVWHIADGSEQMMFLADITNRPELLARRPGFHAVYDFDAETAEASRRRVLDRVSADRMRVSGFHFPFPAIGHMAKEGDGYRFVQADWAAS